MTEGEALLALRGENREVAARAASFLWQAWHRSGDAGLASILTEGMAAMERQDSGAAEKTFTGLIEAAPGFAEGWSKRATVRYIAKNYEGSIADCRQTLARNPSHFGALSGQGLCHMALGEWAEAAAMFRRALAVYPHLENARENLSA